MRKHVAHFPQTFHEPSNTPLRADTGVQQLLADYGEIEFFLILEVLRSSAGHLLDVVGGKKALQVLYQLDSQFLQKWKQDAYLASPYAASQFRFVSCKCKPRRVLPH